MAVAGGFFGLGEHEGPHLRTFEGRFAQPIPQKRPNAEGWTMAERLLSSIRPSVQRLPHRHRGLLFLWVGSALAIHDSGVKSHACLASVRMRHGVVAAHYTEVMFDLGKKIITRHYRQLSQPVQCWITMTNRLKAIRFGGRTSSKDEWFDMRGVERRLGLAVRHSCMGANRTMPEEVPGVESPIKGIIRWWGNEWLRACQRIAPHKNNPYINPGKSERSQRLHSPDYK